MGYTGILWHALQMAGLLIFRFSKLFVDQPQFVLPSTFHEKEKLFKRAHNGGVNGGEFEERVSGVEGGRGGGGGG